MSTNYNDIDTMMEVLLRRTSYIVSCAYKCHKELEKNEETTETSLVFPKYSIDEGANKKGKTRISEQELRFAFVQAFHEYKCKYHCNYLCGIEVPTKDKYLFTDEVDDKIENGETKKKRIYKPRIASDGRSGSFDMVIYDEKLNRICLIEFKYGHPDIGSFAKDFLKLANPNEEGEKRYFIHLMKEKNNVKTSIPYDIGNIYQDIDTQKVCYRDIRI